MGLGPNTTHFFLKCLVEHPSSKISSFFFTFALDTHVRIVIPETWRCRKVCFVRIRVMTLYVVYEVNENRNDAGSDDHFLRPEIRQSQPIVR